MSVDVLAINLTRFGDLLQSQAAISDLHASGFTVGIVCLANFTSALPLLRHVQASWPLPGSKLLAQIDANWPQACETLLEFANKTLESARPKYILNLTPTLPARLLTRLLAMQGAKVLGFGMDDLGYGVNHGVWSSFVAVAAARRGNSPFNLADMLRMLAAPLTGGPKGSHLLAPVPKEARDWAKDFLAGHKPGEEPAGFVALQLGASQDRRRWPVEQFRQLARILWQNERLCPVLLGSANEKALGDKFAKNLDIPLINAIGATNISQLGALLCACRLLVTNDTGTMHLAAGLGVHSLSFFLATAQPWDTGPTLPNCCCLEPALECHPCAFGQECLHDQSCRTSISPEAAASLVSSFLQTNTWQPEDAENLNCRAWLTEVDERNFCKIIPLKEQPGPGIWLAWQRIFWENALATLETANASHLANEKIYQNLRKPDHATQTGQILFQVATLLSSLAEYGSEAAKNPALAKIFMRNCERIQTLLDTWRPLHSLALFWREFRTSQVDDLKLFAKQCEILSRHVQVLGQALSK